MVDRKQISMCGHAMDLVESVNKSPRHLSVVPYTPQPRASRPGHIQTTKAAGVDESVENSVGIDKSSRHLSRIIDPCDPTADALWIINGCEDVGAQAKAVLTGVISPRPHHVAGGINPEDSGVDRVRVVDHGERAILVYVTMLDVVRTVIVADYDSRIVNVEGLRYDRAGIVDGRESSTAVKKSMPNSISVDERTYYLAQRINSCDGAVGRIGNLQRAVDTAL